MPDTHGSRPRIAGYEYCTTCGELTHEVTFRATKFRCMTCFEGDLKPLEEIEVAVKSVRATIKATAPKKRPNKGRKRPNTEATKRRAQRISKCATADVRAMRRLTNLHPELYTALRNIERHRDGLPPVAWPGDEVFAKAVATYLAGSTYHTDVVDRGDGVDGDLQDEAGHPPRG